MQINMIYADNKDNISSICLIVYNVSKYIKSGLFKIMQLKW